MIGSILQPLLGHPMIKRWRQGEGLPPRLHLVVGLILPIYALCVNMWHVHTFTVDDAYISFRYAVNFADGHGLVYNIGERIEGYTNFFWTLIIGIGLKVGLDPHVTSKVLGAGAAITTVVYAYRISNRLLPFRTLPCIATWLLASSSTFSCYAVFGLETIFFVMLLVVGTHRFLVEEQRDEDRAIPWSGLIFATAGLTRPEAPMYIGILMLWRGKAFFGRRNIVRGLIFVAVVGAHLLWRHGYYGAWVPATLGAKTGDLKQQWNAGSGYIMSYIEHATPVVFFSMFGLAKGIADRDWRILSVGSLFVATLAYILLVGGDWMAYFRFMAPAEPFLFLMVGLAMRSIVDVRDRAANLALILFGAYVVTARLLHLQEAQNKFLKEEKRFWQNAAGQTADWLLNHAPPGKIAIGDIGYVGYKTNYPLLDLLGLVDPVISQLPGGYTRKLGKGFVERFYDAEPDYVVIIMAGQHCNRAEMEGSRLLFTDPRFKQRYIVGHNVQVNANAAWCIFQHKRLPPPPQ